MAKRAVVGVGGKGEGLSGSMGEGSMHNTMEWGHMVVKVSWIHVSHHWRIVEGEK